MKFLMGCVLPYLRHSQVYHFAGINLFLGTKCISLWIFATRQKIPVDMSAAAPQRVT